MIGALLNTLTRNIGLDDRNLFATATGVLNRYSLISPLSDGRQVEPPSSPGARRSHQDRRLQAETVLPRSTPPGGARRAVRVWALQGPDVTKPRCAATASSKQARRLLGIRQSRARQCLAAGVPPTWWLGADPNRRLVDRRRRRHRSAFRQLSACGGHYLGGSGRSATAAIRDEAIHAIVLSAHACAQYHLAIKRDDHRRRLRSRQQLDRPRSRSAQQTTPAAHLDLLNQNALVEVNRVAVERHRLRRPAAYCADEQRLGDRAPARRRRRRRVKLNSKRLR